MTREELDQQIERAVGGFSSIEGLEPALAERLVGEGFLSYDDLSVIEPEDLMEMGGLSREAVDAIVLVADQRSAQAEVVAADQRRRQRDQDRVEVVAPDEELSIETLTQQPADEKSDVLEGEVAELPESAAFEVSAEDSIPET